VNDPPHPRTRDRPPHILAFCSKTRSQDASPLLRPGALPRPIPRPPTHTARPQPKFRSHSPTPPNEIPKTLPRCLAPTDPGLFNQRFNDGLRAARYAHSRYAAAKTLLRWAAMRRVSSCTCLLPSRSAFVNYAPSHRGEDVHGLYVSRVLPVLQGEGVFAESNGFPESTPDGVMCQDLHDHSRARW
jgi:hypothetical protein